MKADRLVPAIGIHGCKVAACMLLVLVTGCHERPTTVSGNITLDGQPLTVAPETRGIVMFQPDGGQGTMSSGLIDPSGHFSLATGSSIEVAPGKYYVTVSVAKALPKATQTDHEQNETKLLTPARYTSASESGLQAEVKPGENRLTFDLKSDADDANSRSADPAPEPTDQRYTNPASTPNENGPGS